MLWILQHYKRLHWNLYALWLQEGSLFWQHDGRELFPWYFPPKMIIWIERWYWYWGIKIALSCYMIFNFATSNVCWKFGQITIHSATNIQTNCYLGYSHVHLSFWTNEQLNDGTDLLKLLTFWVQVIMEIPYIFIQTTYFTLIVYTMLGFQWTVVKFFWFFFVTFFTFLYFTYYGMMTVSITPNHQVAAIFAAAFYSLFNLFSGFFIPRPVSPQTSWVLNSVGS